jgi:hypothetical protein
MATALIAAVTSKGNARVALQAANPIAAGTPLADAATISFWTKAIAPPAIKG